MNQSNCKSENVRRPLQWTPGGLHSLIPFPLPIHPYSFPVSTICISIPFVRTEKTQTNPLSLSNHKIAELVGARSDRKRADHFTRVKIVLTRAGRSEARLGLATRRFKTQNGK